MRLLSQGAQVAASADNSAPGKKEEAKSEAPKKKEDAAKEEKKEGGEEKVFITPTLPRLKRHLQPIKGKDYWGGRYDNSSLPNWSGQTAYGPPGDVHNHVFTEDVMLGAESKNKPSDVRHGQPLYQIEFGSFRAYNQALMRKKLLVKKASFSVVICDIVSPGGDVRYSLRTRTPMSRSTAQETVLKMIQKADIVGKVVPYVF